MNSVPAQWVKRCWQRGHTLPPSGYHLDIHPRCRMWPQGWEPVERGPWADGESGSVQIGHSPEHLGSVVPGVQEHRAGAWQRGQGSEGATHPAQKA